MSLILNIDTALDTASVCLSKDNELLHMAVNENQKEHAMWLHTAVADILQKSGHTINELQAVAVSIGPGSYTGLRVGLASAKGFCYALNIPLIAISTLKMIALATKNDGVMNENMICPMIDARRMEVFTAIYDINLVEIRAAAAMIIDENSFSAMLESNRILFCGNGSKKLQKIITSPNALFSNTIANASHLAQLSFSCFQNKEFASLAYIEPSYIKEFYSPTTRVN
jgi:tRNA threonylcarbamoyladenosine biosynthesis protein TsaB